MNLTDTSNCPLGHRCESCGTASPGVTVVARVFDGQAVCLTLCPRCAVSSESPPILPSAIRRFAEQHRLHVLTKGEPSGRHQQR